VYRPNGPETVVSSYGVNMAGILGDARADPKGLVGARNGDEKGDPSRLGGD